jgi:hypothetical protein
MDEGVEDHHLCAVFPPKKVTVSCHYTCKGICMAAFMDESGVETRNGRTHIGGTLRSHFKTIAFRQGQFPPLQFSGHEIRNFLVEQRSLISDCNVYQAETATDQFVPEGGDVAMH